MCNAGLLQRPSTTVAEPIRLAPALKDLLSLPQLVLQVPWHCTCCPNLTRSHDSSLGEPVVGHKRLMCQCTDHHMSLPPLHVSFTSACCSDFCRLPPESATDLVTHLIHTTDEPSVPAAADLHCFSAATRLSLLPAGTCASSVPQGAFSSILWTSVPFALDHWPSTQDRVSDRVSTNLFVVLTLFSTIAHART